MTDTVSLPSRGRFSLAVVAGQAWPQPSPRQPRCRTAFADVQRLKGLGPFCAGLVVPRASGFADAPLMAPEPKILGHAAVYYGLDNPPTLEAFSAISGV